MQSSIMEFFSKCDQIRRNCRFGYIYQEILRGKLHFFCNVSIKFKQLLNMYFNFKEVFATQISLTLPVPCIWCYFIKGALSGLRKFLATESHLKIMIFFYFTLKALFFLKIFSFCLDFLVMCQNGLIEKTRLISNFMTSQLS